MGQIQGKLVLLRVSGEFELPRVRVTEGSSYRGSTVVNVTIFWCFESMRFVVLLDFV